MRTAIAKFKNTTERIVSKLMLGTQKGPIKEIKQISSDLSYLLEFSNSLFIDSFIDSYPLMEQFKFWHHASNDVNYVYNWLWNKSNNGKKKEYAGFANQLKTIQERIVREKLTPLFDNPVEISETVKEKLAELEKELLPKIKIRKSCDSESTAEMSCELGLMPTYHKRVVARTFDSTVISASFEQKTLTPRQETPRTKQRRRDIKAATAPQCLSDNKKVNGLIARLLDESQAISRDYLDKVFAALGGTLCGTGGSVHTLMLPEFKQGNEKILRGVHFNHDHSNCLKPLTRYALLGLLQDAGYFSVE